jgi:hypothetical protein
LCHIFSFVFCLGFLDAKKKFIFLFNVEWGSCNKKVAIVGK